MSLEGINKLSFMGDVNIRAIDINAYFKRFKSKTLRVYDKTLSVEEEKNLNSKLQDDFDELELKYINFIKDCYNLNNENLIIDFYVNRLDNDAISKILEVLKESEKQDFLNLMKDIDKDKTYFRVKNAQVLEIIVKLNTRNMFFSTFYFLKEELTLWGNYDLKFPMFFVNDEVIDLYEKIAQKNNLNVI